MDRKFQNSTKFTLGIFSILIPIVVSLIPLISTLETIGLICSLILSVVVLFSNDKKSENTSIEKICGGVGLILTLIIGLNNFI